MTRSTAPAQAADTVSLLSNASVATSNSDISTAYQNALNPAPAVTSSRNSGSNTCGAFFGFEWLTPLAAPFALAFFGTPGIVLGNTILFASDSPLYTQGDEILILSMLYGTLISTFSSATLIELANSALKLDNNGIISTLRVLNILANIPAGTALGTVFTGAPIASATAAISIGMPLVLAIFICCAISNGGCLIAQRNSTPSERRRISANEEAPSTSHSSTNADVPPPAAAPARSPA